MGNIERFALAIRDGGMASAVSKTAAYCARRGMLALMDEPGHMPLSRHPSARTLLIESSRNPDPRTGEPGDAWGLGDAVFKFPAISALHAASGQRVDVVTAPGREAVFRRSPDVGTVMTSEDGWLELVARIRRERYTHVFALHPSWRMLLLALCAGAGTAKAAYFAPEDVLRGNHIEMNTDAVRRMAGSLPDTGSWPRMGREHSEVSTGLYRIGLNIWANSSHRHFRHWEEVLDRLGGDIPPEVRFVLVGKHNALGVNESLAKKYPDIVLDYVGVTDLAGTYGLIASCDAFIGPDGGNINAAIAMLPPGGVFPIYGMVNPEARLPGGFPQENIIRGRCPLGDGGCFERVQWQHCHCEATGQEDSDHSAVVPCMSDALVIDEITANLRRVFAHVRAARRDSRAA